VISRHSSARVDQRCDVDVDVDVDGDVGNGNHLNTPKRSSEMVVPNATNSGNHNNSSTSRPNPFDDSSEESQASYSTNESRQAAVPDSPSVDTDSSGSVDGDLFSALMGKKDSKVVVSPAVDQGQQPLGVNGRDSNPFDDSDDESVYDADEPVIPIPARGEKHNANKSVKPTTPNAHNVTSNPFDDNSVDDSDMDPRASVKNPIKNNSTKKTLEPIGKADSCIVKQNQVKPTTSNPYGVTPNPFDDSSVDDSFIGTVSSNLDDTSTVVGNKKTQSCADSIASTGTSVDGDLFSGFQSFLTKKHHQDDVVKPITAKLEGNSNRNLIVDRSKILDKRISSGGSCASSSFGGFSIESLNEESVVEGKAVKKECDTMKPVDEAKEYGETECNDIKPEDETSKRDDDKLSREVDPVHHQSTAVPKVVKDNVEMSEMQAKKNKSSNPFGSFDSGSMGSSSSFSCVQKKSGNPFGDADKSVQEFDADESVQEVQEFLKDVETSKSKLNENAIEPASIVMPSKDVEKPSNIYMDTSSFADSSSLGSSQTSTLESNSHTLKNTPNLVEKGSIQRESPSAKQMTAPPKNNAVSPMSITTFGAGKSPEQKTSNAKNVTPSPKKKWQLGVDSFDSSVESSLDSPPPIQRQIKSDNPFADILAMRAKERKENHWIVQQMMKRDSNISQMDLESSSQEDNISDTTPSTQQSRVVIGNTEKVKTNPFADSVMSDSVLESIQSGQSEDSSDESSESSVSLEESAFTNVRKALSNIQSMSYETNEEDSYEEEESVDEGVDKGDGEDSADETHVVAPKIQGDDAANMAGFYTSRSEAFNDYSEEEASTDYTAPPKQISTESYAVSSLKTTDFKATYKPEFDMNQTFDDDEDAVSVPSLFDKMCKKKDTEKGGELDCKEMESGRERVSKKIDPTSESGTAGSSIDRVIKISPPRKPVVLYDGSISTKDSIVGTTIRVTNADMVAERIYLESLRAQVHAELKVHVADEEIRFALEERMNAIRDYYKRKTTTTQLKSKHAGDEVTKDGASYVSSPKHSKQPGRPKILLDRSVVPNSPTSAITDVSSLSCPKGIIAGDKNSTLSNGQITDQIKLPSPSEDSSTPSLPKGVAMNSSSRDPAQGILSDQIKLPPSTEDSSTPSFPKGITMNSSTRDDQKHAYERAEANIQNALKSVSVTMNQSDVGRRGEYEIGEDEEIMNRVLPKASISQNIHSHQTTSWDNEVAKIPKPFGGKSPMNIAIPAVNDAWNFYSQINSLMSDNRVYEYEFQAIQKDPLYPYLNSLTGIADSGDDGIAVGVKKVKQRMREEFTGKSPHRICHILAREAKEIQPELIEICEDIARKLNIYTIAVGPVKTASSALIKSEKKYAGNPLFITDFCRVSLFVPDIATLLALIEIALSKYAYIVKRIKLSNLKRDHSSIIGGYRDCKINIDIDGHICEIQVHLERLWNIKEESGYNHYRQCFVNNVTESTYDVSRTLLGLDREFLSDMIKVGEDAVKDQPVTALEYSDEKQIRDYCALAYLYIYYGLPVRAEYTLRQIVKLRTENVLFGPGHAETIMYLKMLKTSLKMQHKYKSAMAVSTRISRAEKPPNNEDDIVGLCARDQCGALDHICDSILDPSRKERMEEKEKLQLVEESRAVWLVTRKSFFRK